MSSEGSAYTIFNDALELSDPAARARYVNEACAGDSALFERVGKLLLAHGEAGGFFSQPLKSAPVARPASSNASPVIEQPGDTIGRYKLLEQIGEGGCGVVYMAEQQEPVRRRVALKVIKLGMDTKQVVARFEAERQALALMDHPNIAKVFDAGATDTGRPYFVMELVRGIKITDFCDQKKLSTSERLELFIAVCRAVEHAHQKGIIHRDLKPSNMLVTIVDGAPVPKVIDFGIAKATNNQPLTDKTVFTAFQQFIGTPAYMSPEQAEMSGVDIDTRSDIYSLGVVFYELLTGKTPFDAEALLRSGIDEIRRTIRDQAPPKPSTRLHGLTQPDLNTTAQARLSDGHKLIQTVKGDLDWIVMKCLEKDRSRRYETAHGLAMDARRYLDQQPVQARPPSRLYELRKTIRRHKTGFAAVTAVVLALAIGLGVSISTLAKERKTRKRAVAAEQESQRQLYSALLAQARATVRSGELGQRVQALDAIRRAAAITNAAELRREVFAALALPDLRFERDLPKGDGVTLAQLDPAFEQLARVRGRGPVEIRAVSDNRLLASLPASTNIPAYLGMWSAEGRFLAVKRDQQEGGSIATLEVWDLDPPSSGFQPDGMGQTGSQRYDPQRVLLLHDLRFDALSFHPRLPRIIASQKGGFAAIWDLTDGRAVARFKMPNEAVDLKFSPDGERFAALSQPEGHSTLSVHNTTNGALLASHRFPTLAGVPAWRAAWHPHGRWIATVDGSGAVYLMDSRTGESRALGEHKAAAVTAVFSPDGGYLFTGSWDNEFICWDLRTMRAAFTIALNAFELQFNAAGDRCAVFTQEGTIKLRAFERPIPRELSVELGSGLLQATFSADGRWLATAGDKGGGVWDLSDDTLVGSDDQAYETQFFFTPDGSELFGSRNRENDSRGFRWRLASVTNPGARPELTRLPLSQPEGFTFMTQFSNSIVMTGAKGSQALARGEFETGNDRWTRTDSGINGVSPDGKWLAIYRRYSRSLSIYRMPGLEPVAKLTPSAGFYVYSFEFSPRGDEVAVGSRWGVEFWSTSTWQRTHAVTNFMRILYTPDAHAWWLTRDFFSAGGLYDARTLEPLLLLPYGTVPLALSADGRTLALSVAGRRLQLWDLVAVRQQLRELGLDWDEKLAALKPEK